MSNHAERGDERLDGEPAVAERAQVIAAAVTLSVVAVAAFLVMPQFVDAAVEDLKFGQREAGILSALVMTGAATSSLLAASWVRRVSWRHAALVTLLGLIAANGASIFCHSFIAFVALQGVGGLFGGSLYSLALTVLSDGRHPDRSFGFSLATQVAFQVVGLLAGPTLLHHGGINAILVAFVAFGALSLLVVRYLPEHGRTLRAGRKASGLLGGPIVFALVGCFLFFFNVGCYWTYIELMGSAVGLGLRDMANGLAVGVAFGIAGALLASWLGERRGRLGPIAICAALTVSAVLVLIGHFRLSGFVTSAIVYNFAWNLSLAYQYAVVNAVDRSGRGVAIAPAFHGAGGAVGPAVAALLVSEHNHDAVVWLVCTSVAVSLACFAAAAWLGSRATARSPSTPDRREPA